MIYYKSENKFPAKAQRRKERAREITSNPFFLLRVFPLRLCAFAGTFILSL
jgi:hypothetical protein